MNQAATCESDPLLSVTDVSRTFDVSRPFLARVLSGEGRRVLKAVTDVSLEVRRGETLSLVGESGCGKSTLARLIVGLYRPSTGTITFDGVPLTGGAGAREVRTARRRMQMVFQDPYASLNPRWKVRSIIAEPMRVQGRGGAAARARVDRLLQQVGLSPADRDKYPHEFSGGQRQRISIARALSVNPEFLVCDEPTSALDVSVQAQILNLMHDLQREFGLTYLFISHNLAVIYHVSDRIGVMYLGRIVELAEKRTLFRTPQHPYTRMLLEAIPDLELSGRARTAVGGEVPSPIDPPPGCPFHPRCPFANDRCRQEIPIALPATNGSVVACHAVEEKRLPEPVATELPEVPAKVLA